MRVKNFEVDLDSVEDCQKLINQLKSNIGELRILTHGSKKQRVRSVFEACQKIYNTDISDLYRHLDLDPNPIYYVYTHSEPSKKIAIGKNGISTFAATLGMELIPFYVGKGVGDRAYDLNRNETHRKVRQKLQQFGQEVSVKILKSGLTEMGALILESKLIDMFGLIASGGKLVNLDEGVNSKERRLKYKDELREISMLYKNSV